MRYSIWRSGQFQGGRGREIHTLGMFNLIVGRSTLEKPGQSSTSTAPATPTTLWAGKRLKWPLKEQGFRGFRFPIRPQEISTGRTFQETRSPHISFRVLTLASKPMLMRRSGRKPTTPSSTLHGRLAESITEPRLTAKAVTGEAISLSAWFTATNGV